MPRTLRHRRLITRAQLTAARMLFAEGYSYDLTTGLLRSPSGRVTAHPDALAACEAVAWIVGDDFLGRLHRAIERDRS